MKDYFILSCIDNGIFVYYNIEDAEQHDKGISYFIYHVLRNNNLIKNDDMNVFIYEHNIVKKTCDLIILQNTKKSELEDFDKENLENIMNEIIEKVGNNSDMFTVSFNNNNFTTSLKPFVYDICNKLTIDTIEYIAI
jgi:hypothetical protein